MRVLLGGHHSNNMNNSNNYQAQATFQEAVNLYQQGLPLSTIQAQTGWTIQNGMWAYAGYNNVGAGSSIPMFSTASTTGAAPQGSGIDLGLFSKVGKTGYNVYNAPEGQNIFGKDGSLGGGWMAALGGAMAGYNQGKKNYEEDPNMWSGEDGFGTYHKDYRAELGGGTLGGVMGYFGGPVGAAVAGPTVKVVHPYAEKFSRNMINFGDKWGGATGAMLMDPAAAASSGKYSWGEIFQVPFTKKLFNW